MTIGKVFGIIMLGILVMFLLMLVYILSSRAWIRYQGEDGEHRVWIGIGMFHFRIFPRKKKAKKPAREKQEKRPETETKNKTLQQRDWNVLLDLGLQLLERMRHVLEVQILDVKVVLATEEPATTGILLGTSTALTGIFYPYIREYFDIPRFKIILDADFEKKNTHWKVECKCAAHLGKTVCALIRSRKLIWELVKCFQNNKEETNERTSDYRTDECHN